MGNRKDALPNELGEGGGAYESLRLSEADEKKPHCRCGPGGRARLDVEGSRLFAEIGSKQGVPVLFSWAEVVEGKESRSFSLVPRKEKSNDYLQVRWTEGGHVAVFSLRRLYRVKQFTLPKGHTLKVTCQETKLPDHGPALELLWASAVVEPITRHDTPGAAAQ